MEKIMALYAMWIQDKIKSLLWSLNKVHGEGGWRAGAYADIGA